MLHPMDVLLVCKISLNAQQLTESLVKPLFAAMFRVLSVDSGNWNIGIIR